MAPGVLATQRRDAIARAQHAFAELVRERGYDGITLADVATRAGMARTSMYNYYRSKEELLVDCTVASLDDFLLRLRGELRRTSGAREQLRVFGRQLIVYYEQQGLPSAPALRTIVSTDANDRIAERSGALEQLLREILVAGARSGEFPQQTVDDRRTVSLVMACFSRDPHDPATPATPEGGIDEVVDATLEFVMRALGAQT